MPEGSLTIGLFDQGMTPLHRVGLAGLYMTLKHLNPAQYEKAGGWELHPHDIRIFWKDKPANIVGPIIQQAFGLSKQGCIEFLAQKNCKMGDVERFLFHKSVFQTFHLRHPQIAQTEKQESSIVLDFGDRTVTQTFKPVKAYRNQRIADVLFDKKGVFRDNIDLAGWTFPGGTVRHVAYAGATTLSSSPGLFLTLAFAPVASLYFIISSKDTNGNFDSRKDSAVILPHLRNLEDYYGCYARYLGSPVERLYASGPGDAAMLALTTLHLSGSNGKLGELEVDSCSSRHFRLT